MVETAYLLDRRETDKAVQFRRKASPCAFYRQEKVGCLRDAHALGSVESQAPEAEGGLSTAVNELWSHTVRETCLLSDTVM